MYLPDIHMNPALVTLDAVCNGSLVLVAAWPATAATKKTYRMTGTITAIEPAYHTVVIEVPQGQGMFTVGGPLRTTAVLKSGKTV